MANIRKRLLTKTIRAGIAAEMNVYWHYEWVEEVAGGQWIATARAWQSRCIQAIQKYLNSIWIYRIKPTELHLPSDVSDELENWGEWFEYLTGMPENEAEATTPWYERIYGGTQ